LGRCVLDPLWSISSRRIIRIYRVKGAVFGKILIGMKRVFRFSLQLSSEDFFSQE
jgi:hypothetical protein